MRECEALCQNAFVPSYALLTFHFPSDGLRAWRLALRLDREFAGRCLERIQVISDLKERYPDVEELRCSLGEQWDDRVRVLEILRGEARRRAHDDDLDDFADAAIVDELPAFARDVSDRQGQFVSLGVSPMGIWVDFVEEPGEPTNTAEFVTEGQLEEFLRTVR